VEDATIDPRAPDTVVAPVNSTNSGLVMYTTSGGDDWQIVDSLAHPRYSFVSIEPSGAWYVVSDGPSTTLNDGVWRSTDSGASFDFLGPLSGGLMDHDIVGVFEQGGGERLVVAGKYWSVGEHKPFISHSTDGGATWDELWRGGERHRPNRLAATRAGDVYLSIDEELITHVSPDGQVTTLEIPQVEDARVLDMAACWQDAATLYAVGVTNAEAIDTGLVASSDGGESWSLRGLGGEPGEEPRKVAVHPHDCDMVFVATSRHRVLMSQDGGATWEPFEGASQIGAAHLRVTRVADSLDSVLLVVGSGGVVAADLLTETR
jgi:photosystem II stability/assembly factor-like uncharacterized protein